MKRYYDILYLGRTHSSDVISEFWRLFDNMIKIVLRNKAKETALVELLHGEAGGRIYTNFAIKGKTRKMRRGKLYQVVTSRA